MFALSPAFESLLSHILARLASSNTPTVFSAHLLKDVSDADAELDSDSDSDSDSDGSTAGNSSIFDSESDDESDSGSSISDADSDSDEEFKCTPISSIPIHVIDEYAVSARVRSTPFVYGRPSPLRASWTAEEVEVATDFSLDEDEEELGAVGDLLSFFTKPTTLSWADDDCEGLEDLNDLVSHFAKSTPATTTAAA